MRGSQLQAKARLHQRGLLYAWRGRQTDNGPEPFSGARLCQPLEHGSSPSLCRTLASYTERPALLQVTPPPLLGIVDRITFAHRSLHEENAMASTNLTNVSLEPFAVSDDGRRYWTFVSTEASLVHYARFVVENFPSHYGQLHRRDVPHEASEQIRRDIARRDYNSGMSCQELGCQMANLIPWARDLQAPLRPQTTMIVSMPPLSRTVATESRASADGTEEHVLPCRMVCVMLAKFDDVPRGGGIQVQSRIRVPWDPAQGVPRPILTLDGQVNTVWVPESGSMGLTLSSGRFRSERDCTISGTGSPAVQMSENETFAWRGCQDLSSSHDSLVDDLVDGLSRLNGDERVANILSDLRHFAENLKSDGSSGILEQVVRTLCGAVE